MITLVNYGKKDQNSSKHENDIKNFTKCIPKNRGFTHNYIAAYKDEHDYKKKFTSTKILNIKNSHTIYNYKKMSAKFNIQNPIGQRASLSLL